MYPVKLGFDEAKNRIERLIENGHHAEALLTSVFTFEKILHRTLKQLMISAGFRSIDANLLLTKTKGLSNQKEIWPIFEPNNRKLPDIIGNTYWQHIGKAVKMRNNLVHGARVYNLAECMDTANQIVTLLDKTVDVFQKEYNYDGWSRVSVRIKAVLHSDPKVRRPILTTMPMGPKKSILR